MSYEEYCRKNILEPNGIYDMILARNLPEEKAPFEVTYYEPSDAILKPSLYNHDQMVLPSYGGNDIEALGGAGAWLSTAPDLIRFMLTVDGFDTKKDILSKQSIEFMTDNNNGFAPVGWKTTVSNGTWWRTGSFPGTAGMMKRLPDGICWVVLLNTSAWNGPEIYNYINSMMTRAIAQIKSWPDYDLFDYSLPAPIRASVISPDSITLN
jgi:CubicO group peptidase (beta-lactamase class C family)